MKRLTESQIRQIVKQELKNVLFEQDNKKEEKKPSKLSNRIRVLGSILAALAVATLPGHTSSGAGGVETTSSGRTFEQVLADAGLKPEFKNELRNNFQIEEIEKLASLGQMQKELKKNINDEKAKGTNANQEFIEDLTKREAKIFSGENISPELLSKIESSGSVIFNYITDLNDEELNDLKDSDVDQLKQIVQSKAFVKSVNPKQLTKSMSTKLSNDIMQLFREIESKGLLLSVSGDAMTDLRLSAIVHYEQKLPQDFTILDVVRAASDDETLDFNSSLLNPSIYEESILEEFNKHLEKKNIEQIKIDAAKKLNVDPKQLEDEFKIIKSNKETIKENKVSKLRQRLNELRGVYV